MPKNQQSDLYAMRHSLAHIMAAAITRLHPSVKLGIGPVVENGFYYDVDLGERQLSEDDFENIESEMRKIISEDQLFEQSNVPIDEAIKWAKDNKQPYKAELLNDLKREGTTLAAELDSVMMGLPAGIAGVSPGKAEVGDVSFYKNGDFTDLCRGPHVESTGKVGAFKLTRVAGAYWRGKETNPQMQRLYGAAFNTEAELKQHLANIEEAKKWDHRSLGERLDLFALSPGVGAGLVLWLPNGTVLKEEVERLGKETEAKYGYQRVSTPHIAKEELFYTSGHLPYYKDDMYPPMQLENDTYYLKPMNCPHMHMVYKARLHSYRDLPLRYAEFGTVYRYEESGTLMGMMRVRGMTQNDAHLYCTEDQVVDELVDVMSMHRYYYELFGIKDYYVELALPDFTRKKDKYFDDPEGWQRAVELLRAAAKKSGIKAIEKEGEAAFYGPKFDFNIKSVTGREFGASTNQLDFGSGKRFGLVFTDRDGQDKPVPYIIHRAPLGSTERFVGFLVEHYAGAFPVWLAPEQIRILTVNQEEPTVTFAQKVMEGAKELNLRATLDNSNESVGKKIRAAELMKIPYTIVIGEKEIESGEVVPRVRSDMEVKKPHEHHKIEDFLRTVANEAKTRVSKTSL